jgi:hypothetical protein
MTKWCSFVFGQQQYDEMVHWGRYFLNKFGMAAVLRIGATLCLEVSSMTKRCSFVFGGQQYDETVQFYVWRAAV